MCISVEYSIDNTGSGNVSMPQELICLPLLHDNYPPYICKGFLCPLNIWQMSVVRNPL